MITAVYRVLARLVEHRLLAMALGAMLALSASTAQAGWISGSWKQSSVINCPSIIFATPDTPPYPETGATTFVSYWSDAGTRANNTYYTSIVVSAPGNPCSQQRFYAEIQLPRNTTPDFSGISSGVNPIMCFVDKQRTTAPSDCPQTLQNSLYGTGGYWYPSTDSANANLWPLPTGHMWEFLIPVKSTTTLSNITDSLQANIHVLDGNSSPWLYPTVGVTVAAGTGTTLTPQTITFGANPGPRSVSAGNFAVAATGGLSGNPVTFNSKTPSVCTTGGVNGATVSPVTTGTCTIAANQAGNASYSAALEVVQNIVIQAATLTPQTITFGANPGPVNFTAGGTFLVSATASSGLPVVFGSTTPGVCTVSGSTVTMVASGTCTITADQAGNSTYAAAAQASQSVEIRSFLLDTSIAWRQGHIMGTSRTAHTATLLPNGKVLVAGGFGGTPNAFLSSAELYDPVSNTWTPATGAMLTARRDHTATALTTVGEVLVTGGTNSNGTSLATVELYYPASNTSWSAMASMSTPRHWHSATRLQDGRVLVVGGTNDPAGNQVGPWLNSAEIYNRTTNTWTTVASMASVRSAHTATLLANGKVLVVGGTNGTSTSLGTGELYDPASNTWTTINGFGSRSAHTATLLADGRVLVVGGCGNPCPLADAVIYNPTTGATTTAASLPGGSERFRHTASLMPNGQVVVTGGYGATPQLRDTVVYDPSTNTWTTVNPMAYSRESHSAVLLPNGKFMVAGGYANVNGTIGATNTIELIENANLSWGAGGGLAQARGSFTATLLPNGKVLAVGGHTSAARATSAGSVESYDPNGNFWMAGPDLTTQRGAHTANLLTTGKLLVAGGVTGSNYLNSTELYDLTLNTWSNGPAMTTSRAFHTSTMMQSGDVVVVGGETTGGAPTASTERYVAATGSWTTAGSLVAARAEHTATMLGNGAIVVAGGRGVGGLSLSTVEMLNPANSLTTWGSAGTTLGTPRHGHTATTLPDYMANGVNMVLFTGGFDSNTNTYLRDVQMFNPVGTNAQTRMFTLPFLTTPRAFHKAILLTNGKVLVVGGRTTGGVPVKTAELYDPAAQSWTNLGEISLARSDSALTLLATGKVLVSGGFSGTTPVPSGLSDLLDLGVPASRQSTLNSARASSATGKVSLTGAGLTGDSEASGGTSQSSASNVPAVQLRREDNGLVKWLSPVSFSAAGYLSDGNVSLPYGVYRATPIINGVVGNSMLFSFPSPAIAPDAPSIASVQAGPGTITVNFNAPYDNGGATIDWYTVTCTPTGGGTPVTVQGTGTSIQVTGLAKGASYSCSVTAHNSAGTGTSSLALTTTTRKNAGITPILMLLMD